MESETENSSSNSYQQKPKVQAPNTPTNTRKIINQSINSNDEDPANNQSKRAKRRMSSSSTTLSSTHPQQQQQHDLVKNRSPNPSTTKSKNKTKDFQSRGRKSSILSNDDDEISQQTKIQNVLKILKEDVVSINKAHNNSHYSETRDKWKSMIDNNNIFADEKIQQKQHGQLHEQVDRADVGANLYSNKWRRLVHNSRAFQRSSSASEQQHNVQTDPDNRSRNVQFHGDSGDGQQNYYLLTKQPKNSFDYIYSTCYYISGLLAGILIWPALFSLSNLKGESILIKGPIFWTFYSLITTIFILIVAIGFMNSFVSDANNKNNNNTPPSIGTQFCHFIPIILILISHYINKALELQKMECKAYSRLKPEDQIKIHLSYNCSSTTTTGNTNSISSSKNNQNDDESANSIGFMILHLLPCLGSLGIYTYLHYYTQTQNFSSTNSISSIGRQNNVNVNLNDRRNP